MNFMSKKNFIVQYRNYEMEFITFTTTSWSKLNWLTIIPFNTERLVFARQRINNTEHWTKKTHNFFLLFDSVWSVLQGTSTWWYKIQIQFKPRGSIYHLVGFNQDFPKSFLIVCDCISDGILWCVRTANRWYYSDEFKMFTIKNQLLCVISS